MANSYQAYLHESSNYKESGNAALKKFKDLSKSFNGVGLVILAHPAGSNYYENEIQAAMKMGFEVMEYCEWINSIHPKIVGVLNSREANWVAEHIAQLNNIGVMKTVDLISSCENHQSVTQQYEELLAKNGYATLKAAEEKLATRNLEPNLRFGGVCVLDGDYISAEGIKLLDNYARQSEINFLLNINHSRAVITHQNAKVSKCLRFLELDHMVSDTSHDSTIDVINCNASEMVDRAIKICRKNRGGVIVSDNARETMLIELILSCGEVRYKRFGGSVVETSKGIRAYNSFLMFLMGKGVKRLNELCDCLGINYTDLFNAAKEKKDSIRYEEYQKVLSYCFFSEYAKDVSLLHEIMDCRQQGINEATKVFYKCIEPKLSDKEISELKYCLELIGHMDTEERVQVFERMKIYQIEDGAMVKLSMVKEAVTCKNQLTDKAVILVNSDPMNVCKGHFEEICSFAKTGFVMEYDRPQQRREVA